LTPLAASASSKEIVTFPSTNGLILEGALRLPDTGFADKVTGVVLTHGSGAISRDSFVATVPEQELNMLFGFHVCIFRDIGDRLVDAGITVLT